MTKTPPSGQLRFCLFYLPPVLYPYKVDSRPGNPSSYSIIPPLFRFTVPCFPLVALVDPSIPSCHPSTHPHLPRIFFLLLSPSRTLPDSPLLFTHSYINYIPPLKPHTHQAVSPYLKDQRAKRSHKLQTKNLR